MKNKLIILSLIALAFAACDKTIHLDYPTTDPKLVIEARVSNREVKARLSYTQNNDDNKEFSIEKNAVVTISGDDGSTAELLFDPADNWYKPAVATTGEAGVTYTFEAKVAGKSHKAVSKMPDAHPIDSVRYKYMKIMGEEDYFCLVYFHDRPQEDNYYAVFMYVNDDMVKAYEWDVISPLYKNEKGEHTLFLSCSEIDDDTFEDLREQVKAGDKVRIELRTIDEHAFRYLEALRMINPFRPGNPPGGYIEDCLGYFSAYHETVFEETFDGVYQPQ